MNRTTAKAAAAAVLIIAVTGCSSSDGGGEEGRSKGGSSPAPAPVEELRAVARSHQEAANRRDWKAACELRTERLRGGTVQQCADRNTPSTAKPSPSEAASSPSFEPPRYADGSTPEPRSRPSSSGPEFADTGAVTASEVVTVPAAEDHPAGWGVLVSYTVTWPGKEPETSRRALRLVDERGEWKVDQAEDVHDGDTGRGSAVVAALSGG
ncbi:hypothetical protein ACWDR0_23945 [Streptomyces sp. NPDC003691]